MLVKIGSGLIRMTSKIFTIVDGQYQAGPTDMYTINSSSDRLIIKDKE